MLLTKFNRFDDSKSSEISGQELYFFLSNVIYTFFLLTGDAVMGQIGFNFPIFLTLIHYIAAWILLAIFKGSSLLPISPPSKTTPFTALFSLGVVMSFASELANAGLKHNRLESRLQLCYFVTCDFPIITSLNMVIGSVGFYQMAKIAVTPTIVLAEFILFRKTISTKKVNITDFLCQNQVEDTLVQFLCSSTHFGATLY